MKGLRKRRQNFRYGFDNSFQSLGLKKKMKDGTRLRNWFSFEQTWHCYQHLAPLRRFVEIFALLPWGYVRVTLR